jgi:hypothetical protein
LAVSWGHPNPTRQNFVPFFAPLWLPAALVFVWCLLPATTRAAISVRRIALVHCGLSIGFAAALFLVSPRVLRDFPDWLSVAIFWGGLSAIPGAILALAIAALMRASEGMERATWQARGFLIACLVPLVLACLWHFGHVLWIANKIDRVAGDDPYCVGVYASGGGASRYEHYRPASLYDLTALQMDMDEISPSNGSFLPGAVLSVEIHRGDAVEFIQRWKGGDGFRREAPHVPGITYFEPNPDVLGCAPRPHAVWDLPWVQARR